MKRLRKLCLLLECVWNKSSFRWQIKKKVKNEKILPTGWGKRNKQGWGVWKMSVENVWEQLKSCVFLENWDYVETHECGWRVCVRVKRKILQEIWNENPWKEDWSHNSLTVSSGKFISKIFKWKKPRKWFIAV